MSEIEKGVCMQCSKPITPGSIGYCLPCAREAHEQEQARQPSPDFFMIKSVLTDAQEKLDTADLNVLVAILTDAKNHMIAKDRAGKLIKKLSNLLKATT